MKSNIKKVVIENFVTHDFDPEVDILRIEKTTKQLETLVKQQIIELVEGMRRPVNTTTKMSEGVYTTTAMWIPNESENKVFNQAIDDIVQKIKELEQ